MNAAKPIEQNRHDFEKSDINVEVVPGYRIIKQIGHGSQGEMYLGESLSDGQRVAIKKLNIDSLKNWKAYDLFHREAEVLSSLNIDGVAKFYTAIERLEDKPPCSYIVQEYIEGRTLAEIIHSGTRFSLERVFEFVLQMLNILEKLHSHDPVIIHRDIKPSNILLNRESGIDKYYLIDFGAVSNPQVQGGGSTVAGTFGYMPPEQLMGKPCPASDIYSLAAVIVHLISGVSPADMPQKDFLLMFEPYMQNMVPEVVSTLRQMLDPDENKRLCDIEKLRELFTDYLEQDYHHGHSMTVRYSKEVFERKLSSVSELCQPGNIELWQQLPDEVPRAVPECYSHLIIRNSMKSKGLLFRHGQKKGDVYRINSTPVSHIAMRSFGFIFLVVPLILCIAPFFLSFFSSLSFTELVGDGGAWCVFLAIGTIPMVFSIMMFLLLSMNREKEAEKSSGVDITVDGGAVAAILKNGRKTIATVVSVEYIPVKDSAVECAFRIVQETMAEVDIFVEKNEGCQLIVHDLPSFKIRYRFNPPDDDRFDDLVHEIIIHQEPEELKAGDPLPIVYFMKYAKCSEDAGVLENRSSHKSVSSEAKKPDFVASVPFPMVLNEIVDLRDCYCETKSGKLL